MSLLGLLEKEISHAQKSKYSFGMFLLQVPAEVPRGVSKDLPGRTLGYQQYARYRRYLGVVSALRDEELVATRTNIMQVGAQREWGAIAVGLALWPVNGRTADDLLTWARFDAQRQVKAALAERTRALQASQREAGDAAMTARAEAPQAAEEPAGPAVSNGPPLGRFLVQRGYITDEQLHRALEVQRFQHTSLGGLALQHGLLTENDVLDILFRQEESGDLFGEAAVALGLLRQAQIKELLEQQHMNLPPLGQVLQRLGFLKPEDLALALEELSKLLQ